MIVHREDPEGTPYLPNVIVSSSPFVRPDDYGIPITAMHHDDRHVRNTKLPWQEARKHVNPLWEKRSEEHTSELQSPCNLVCRLLLEKKKKKKHIIIQDET